MLLMLVTLITIFAVVYEIYGNRIVLRKRLEARNQRIGSMSTETDSEDAVSETKNVDAEEEILVEDAVSETKNIDADEDILVRFLFLVCNFKTNYW